MSAHALSEVLRVAIERETAKFDRRALTRAVAELTEAYKAIPSPPVVRNQVQRAAYLAVRAPATYAACSRVFAEIERLVPEASIASMLDLGAGPGTALWAAAEVFPTTSRATLIESDAAFVKLGQDIAARTQHPLFAHAKWKIDDLGALALAESDLVAISYALGELPPSRAEFLVRRAWRAAAQFLAIIEPGTPRGFGLVLAARTALIADGAEILAPCPHRHACPMATAGDWCHFSQRLERTSLHRQLKGGELAYEDEKFSYLVASRRVASPGLARVVRHPRKNPGHVQLTLCTDGGIKTQTVARSHKQDYKLARQAEWGDSWGS